MELSFAARELRELCEREALAVKAYGASVAAHLRRRLADLRAAEKLSDLVIGHPCVVDNVIVVRLADGYTLIMAGNQNGGNWQSSDRVKLLEIRSP